MYRTHFTKINMPRHNYVRNRLCASTKNAIPILWHPPEALGQRDVGHSVVATGRGVS